MCSCGIDSPCYGCTCGCKHNGPPDAKPTDVLSDYARGVADEKARIRTGVTGLPWEVAVSFGPIDCDYSCEEGPCGCSGVMRPEGWTTGLEDVLAVVDGES